MRIRDVLVVMAVLARHAWAACPPSCPLPGGGDPRQDCHAEFATTALRLNYPPFDPAHPEPGREVRCFDGDAGCDTDGTVNHECRFDVDVCLLRSADPALPDCTPAEVTAVAVGNASGDPDLQALQTAVNGLLPSTADACTTGQTLRVPLRGPDGRGRFRRSRRTIRLTARTATGTDVDRVKLTCVPRGWPSHGYDHANRRATPVETTLGPANATNLVVKWRLDLQAIEGASGNGVTWTPTVDDRNVYVTSWNHRVYAVRASTGSIRWRYDTGASFSGVQSSATLTADGRLLVGDSTAVVHCLEARTGRLLWKTTLGTSIDHIWGSPTVANGRVFVGIASHNDQPCTQGRLVALDLDTGAELWTRNMVADRICNNDTTIACATDADCGNGTCVASRGAGVTATVAVEPTGETVYVDTVGCYTFPSNGDEDSILKLDAATGSTYWATRVQPPEQFKVCQGDQATYCTTDTDCTGTGPCVNKTFYHDFGFLNGPLLVDADDGLGGMRPLVVSGSKDGSLYALDPADGSSVWTRAVLPAPVTPAFAGFGLFDAAVGFAEQRFFAALYQFIPATMPAPKHLMAFSAVDGSTAWEDEIGPSWGSMAYGGGLLFLGTQNTLEYYAYDATTGTRLKTFTMPDTVSSGASIVDGRVYVGYGVFGAPGGVVALGLP